MGVDRPARDGVPLWVRVLDELCAWDGAGRHSGRALQERVAVKAGDHEAGQIDADEIFGPNVERRLREIGHQHRTRLPIRLPA